MKIRSIAQIILFVALFGKVPCFAGEKGLNGGDICEDRFKIVRDDIRSWIAKDGSAGLTLPKRVLLRQYDDGMIAQIQEARVSCTDDKVEVDNAEKTCKNFVDLQGIPRIVCNTRRFMETSESDQYVLVHHEYAGLAGLEINNGDGSQYLISNQLSEFLEDQIVKKLAVKHRATESDPSDEYDRVAGAEANLRTTLRDALKYKGYDPDTFTIQKGDEHYSSFGCRRRSYLPDWLGGGAVCYSFGREHVGTIYFASNGTIVCKFEILANSNNTWLQSSDCRKSE